MYSWANSHIRCWRGKGRMASRADGLVGVVTAPFYQCRLPAGLPHVCTRSIYALPKPRLRLVRRQRPLPLVAAHKQIFRARDVKVVSGCQGPLQYVRRQSGFAVSTPQTQGRNVYTVR